MIKSTHYQPRRINISLTPLIDVVFILLIFFMLTSSFIKSNVLSFKTAELIRNSKGEINQDTSLQKLHTLLVQVDRVTWRGKVISLNSLAKKLQEQADQTIILTPSPDTDMVRFIYIIDYLRQIKGLKVKMLPHPEYSLAKTENEG